MPPQSALAASARIPIDIRRLPWIRHLALDYAFAYERLEDFYAGDPSSEDAWRGAITKAQQSSRQRDRICDVLSAQQHRRGAPQAALDAVDELRHAETVAIVTGQQAGLFGGPLFTLLKAITAVRIAERVRSEHGVPTVPVFWIDAEDHDWDEVKRCGALDADLALKTVQLGDPRGAREGPVARVSLDATVEDALAELGRVLPPTAFTPELLSTLGRKYTVGTGMVDAFAQWLESLLGGRGLIVFDAADSAAKPIVSHIFAREIERGETTRHAAEAGAALQARGYHAQVTPQDGTVALFHLDGGRDPIRIRGDAFELGGATWSKAALVARAKEAPQELSPNVLLRPIVQDTLFPTVCYVAGPNELAYLGQLGAIYRSFEVPMPLIVQRATATLLDANAMRFLTKHDLPLESLQAQDEAVLNRLLESQLPPAVESSFEEASTMMRQHLARLAAEVRQIDPTLEGATHSALGRIEDDFKKLHAKIIQAAKRKDETLRRQFQHAQAQAFPGGHPQEREIGFVYFLNKYGPMLVDRLHEELTLDMGTHWVIGV